MNCCRESYRSTIELHPHWINISWLTSANNWQQEV